MPGEHKDAKTLIDWGKIPGHLVGNCVLVLECLSAVPQRRDDISIDTGMSVDEVVDVIRTLRMYKWSLFGNASEGWHIYMSKDQYEWVQKNRAEGD